MRNFCTQKYQQFQTDAHDKHVQETLARKRTPAGRQYCMLSQHWLGISSSQICMIFHTTWTEFVPCVIRYFAVCGMLCQATARHGARGWHLPPGMPKFIKLTHQFNGANACLSVLTMWSCRFHTMNVCWMCYSRGNLDPQRCGTDYNSDDISAQYCAENRIEGTYEGYRDRRDSQRRLLERSYNQHITNGSLLTATRDVILCGAAAKPPFKTGQRGHVHPKATSANIRVPAPGPSTPTAHDAGPENSFGAAAHVSGMLAPVPWIKTPWTILQLQMC